MEPGCYQWGSYPPDRRCEKIASVVGFHPGMDYWLPMDCFSVRALLLHEQVSLSRTRRVLVWSTQLMSRWQQMPVYVCVGEWVVQVEVGFPSHVALYTCSPGVRHGVWQPCRAPRASGLGQYVRSIGCKDRVRVVNDSAAITESHRACDVPSDELRAVARRSSGGKWRPQTSCIPHNVNCNAAVPWFAV